MFDLRYLPITTGICGGLLLIINRLFSTEILPSQSRADAVGVIACAVLILTSLLWQRVQPRSPEVVQLDGTQVFDFNLDLPEELRIELAWASHIILTNTVTKSLIIWWDDRLVLRRGILPEVQMSQPGIIVSRAIQTQKPVYLVKLALYPGKVEFDYLPTNTQGVIVQPLSDRGVMILGANVPRSYTQQDENWLEAIAAKLAHSLEKLT